MKKICNKNNDKDTLCSFPVINGRVIHPETRFSVGEANKVFNISHHELRQALKYGQLKCIKLPGPGPTGYKSMIRAKDIQVYNDYTYEQGLKYREN
tara:strand:+ start:32 stop:319 length:288 start_codon:yes stop_codon:yes gene_type:complete